MSQSTKIERASRKQAKHRVIHYHSKVKLRLKNGNAHSESCEAFVLGRESAKEFLDQIDDGRPGHEGHAILRKMLTDALKLPSWKTITIKIGKL